MFSSGLVVGGVVTFILLVAVLIVVGLLTGRLKPAAGDQGSDSTDSGFSSFD
jgi:hypothetical protein